MRIVSEEVVMTAWTRSIRDEKGAVLPLTFFVLVILAGLLLTFVAVSSRDTIISRNHVETTEAFSVAEAGIAHALDTVNGPVVGALPQILFAGQPYGTGGFTYTVQIANNTVPIAGFIADTGGVTDTDAILKVTSIGRLPGVSNSTSIDCVADDRACRKIEVYIRRGSVSPFKRAIWADIGIDMASTSGTDSFDSAFGNYPGWGSAGNHGDVMSNGNITMGGSSLVQGNGTAGGTITGGSSHFTGSTVIGASQVTMPNVDCPVSGYSPTVALGCLAGCSYDAVTGDLSVGGGDKNINLPAMSGIDYYFHDISLTGGATVTLCQYAGPLTAGACPTSGTRASHVNIYISGAVQARGGSFVNTTSDATKLTVIGCGTDSTDWELSGGTGAYYALYAPNHNLKLTGGSDIWGAVVADFDTESGGARIHYDEALSRSPWDFTGRYSVIAGSWRER